MIFIDISGQTISPKTFQVIDVECPQVLNMTFLPLLCDGRLAAGMNHSLFTLNFRPVERDLLDVYTKRPLRKHLWSHTYHSTKKGRKEPQHQSALKVINQLLNTQHYWCSKQHQLLNIVQLSHVHWQLAPGSGHSVRFSSGPTQSSVRRSTGSMSKLESPATHCILTSV